MRYTIENDTYVAELSDLGATIERLYRKKTGYEHIWKYDAAYWPRRTSICFPIMSVLKNDETIINGKTCHLENHGFIRAMVMTVIEQTADAITFHAEANDETRQNYPFDFSFDAAYRLTGDRFIVEYRVKNCGAEPMVYSIGAHTTYNIPIVPGEEMMKDYYLKFAEKETAGVYTFEDGFVLEEKRPALQDSDTLELEHLFDKGCLIFDTKELKSRQVSICSRSGHATTLDFTGYTQIGLWTKPGVMPFLCLEPMCGTADHLNGDGVLAHKPDICSLNPGEERVHTQIITCR